MTTPVQQAREALGARLREIRKDADLTARALAAAMGSHFTKVSKIENGARSPTEQYAPGAPRAGPPIRFRT